MKACPLNDGRINTILKMQHLGPILLDIAKVLAQKGHRHNTRNVHLRSINLHVELELLTNVLDIFETLLIVGASTTNPDIDLVFLENLRKFSESADNSLKCGGNLLRFLVKENEWIGKG